ncbi:hypothetical protein ACX800_22755 [Paenarthrobacter nitroguajacolicus]|uniref:hypothetical protein n=1 Tax=Micrococcaceae TaxID=1268 RepID=UPI001E2FB923|nr:hypothetical protein [Arthrobacter sp. AK01]MCD4850790.1 hypothetical protein [Arthrobacter sp. AK01]
MSVCQLAHQKIECPVPNAEDRWLETFNAVARLEEQYHDPRSFRYNLNAFLASISSIREIIQKELEQRGDVQRWNAERKPFTNDPWLRALARARNVTLHQQAIFDGSFVQIGLYRGRRHKLSVATKVPHDVPSANLLKLWTHSEAGRMLLDDEHSAIGEQYGVWRKYHIKEISESEDVLTMARRGVIRSHDMMAVAHRLYGIDTGYIADDPYISDGALAVVTILLESDLDPTLPSKWGWV